ncbi:hypothetical protein Efla_005618 [Eimeria flavescens]
MEQQSEKIVHELRASAFDLRVVECVCRRDVQRLTNEERNELLTWLQDEAAKAEEKSEESAKIHLCLCSVWEAVKDGARQGGSLEAQLFEAQLPQKCLAAEAFESCMKCLTRFREAVQLALDMDDRVLRSAGYLHGSQSVNGLRLSWAETWVALCLKQDREEADVEIEVELEAWLHQLDAERQPEVRVIRTFSSLLPVNPRELQLVCFSALALCATCEAAYNGGAIDQSRALAASAGSALKASNHLLLASTFLQLCLGRASATSCLLQAYASVIALEGDCYFRFFILLSHTRKGDLARAAAKLQKALDMLAAESEDGETPPLYGRVLRLLCCAELSLARSQRPSSAALEDGSLWNKVRDVFSAEADERLHLCQFCCERIGEAACRRALELAARSSCPQLLAGLAAVLIVRLRAGEGDHSETDSAASLDGLGGGRRADEAAQIEALFKLLLESWRVRRVEAADETVSIWSACAELTERLLESQRWKDAVEWLKSVRAAVDLQQYKSFSVHLAFALSRDGQLAECLAVLDGEDMTEGEELAHTRRLLRLHACVLLNEPEEALRLCRQIAEEGNLTAEEAGALCSDCFSSSQTSPELALECLFLLLGAARKQREEEAALKIACDAAPQLRPEAEDASAFKLLYIAAFYLQKSKETADHRSAAVPAFPLCSVAASSSCWLSSAEGGQAFQEGLAATDVERKQRLFLASAELHALARRCATDKLEEATNGFLHASAVVAAARSGRPVRRKANSNRDEEKKKTTTFPLSAAATLLSHLQAELKKEPTQSKAAANLLRLAFLLEFEAHCLLSQREKGKEKEGGEGEGKEEEGDEEEGEEEGGEGEEGEGGSKREDREDFVCPSRLAERAFKEDLLGPAGLEMLFFTALEVADEATVTAVALALLKKADKWEADGNEQPMPLTRIRPSSSSACVLLFSGKQLRLRSQRSAESYLCGKKRGGQAQADARPPGIQ